MRKALRWRYYCDHCKKVGGSSGHMKAHEESCTANPNRVCRLCRLAGFTAKPLADLKELARSRARWTPSEEWDYGSIDAATLKELLEQAGGCPVCAFAALRQSHVYPPDRFDLKEQIRSVLNNCKHPDENEYAY